jgi:hypothetical protein
MSDVPQQFDDPDLKAALKRLHGSHTASDRLRALVAEKMAAELVADASVTIAPELKPSRSTAMRIHSGFRPLRWLAAAAVLAVIIGGIWGYQRHRASQATEALYARNDELLDGMIDLHKDGLTGGPADRRLTASLDDPTALAKEASDKLGRDVPVIQLKSAGWALDAASLCEVDKSAAARFHFTRGKQSITVISLPAKAWAEGADGSRYDLSADEYPIAGYLKGPSLNCVIGDTSLPLKEVSALLDTIRGS